MFGKIRITLPGVKPIQESKPGYEYFYLYGAVEPETGQRFFAEHERLNGDCFQRFLDRFAEAFPHSHNVLVLDNGQFHKAKKLSTPKNIDLTFLPPYSPELNPVERLWQDIKDRLSFDFYEHLSSLRQETRMVLRSYTDEMIRSLTEYSYLLEATSVLSSWAIGITSLTYPMIKETHECRECCSSDIVKMATAPAALSSTTVRIVLRTRCSTLSRVAIRRRRKRRLYGLNASAENKMVIIGAATQKLLYICFGVLQNVTPCDTSLHLGN